MKISGSGLVAEGGVADFSLFFGACTGTAAEVKVHAFRFPSMDSALVFAAV